MVVPLSEHHQATLLVTSQQENQKLRQNRLLLPKHLGSQVHVLLVHRRSTVTYPILLCCFKYYTDKLSPNHLQQVLDLVWDARSGYYNIGLGLDLPSGTIDAIEKSNSYKPSPIFTEMIKECLRQGLLTQEKLAKAVSSPQAGFAYMSDGILSQIRRCEFIFLIR